MELRSDLRGVIVRNTFLEFDLHDDFLTESGLLRQASEPAKPLNRQVSEQTTADSGMTHEDTCAEPEGYAPFASYPNPSVVQTGAPYCNAVLSVPAPYGAMQSDLAAWQVAAAGSAVQFSPAMHHMVPTFGLLPMPRFCPNCGAEAEQNHRFCPYCCYQLRSFPNVGGGGLEQPGTAVPQAAASSTAAAACSGKAGDSAPDLLGSLTRFRFVEACPTDIEYARTLCKSVIFACKA